MSETPRRLREALLDALATLLAREPAGLRAEHRPVVRELLAEGFLTLRS